MRIMYSNVSSCFLFPARQSCFSGYEWSEKKNEKTFFVFYLCLGTSLQIWCARYIRLCLYLHWSDRLGTERALLQHEVRQYLFKNLVRHLKYQNCPASLNSSVLGIARSLKSDWKWNTFAPLFNSKLVFNFSLPFMSGEISAPPPDKVSGAL